MCHYPVKGCTCRIKSSTSSKKKKKSQVQLFITYYYLVITHLHTSNTTTVLPSIDYQTSKANPKVGWNISFLEERIINFKKKKSKKCILWFIPIRRGCILYPAYMPSISQGGGTHTLWDPPLCEVSGKYARYRIYKIPD